MRSFLTAVAVTLAVIPQSARSQPQAVVNGRITDNETRKSIQSVNVFLRGHKTGTISDTAGSFRLTIPAEEEVVLVFSHVAYQKLTRSIMLKKGEEASYTISLQPDTLPLQEFVIMGKRPIAISEAAKRRALFTLGADDLERLGENDLDKALRYLLPVQVKPFDTRERQPEEDFTLYVNGEWKESFYVSQIDPFAVRRIMVWELLGVDAGKGSKIDVFPIGMPLRSGKFVISVETKY